MRTAPSQTATISLPAEMLDDLDRAAETMSATRSELVRAALRDYLRKLRRQDEVLMRNRIAEGAAAEEALGARVRAGRRGA